MKNVTITKDRFQRNCGLDETDWYHCQSCECAGIARGDNYCCNCGAKITWKLEK